MASLFSAIKYMDENDRKNPDISILVSMNRHLAERGFCVSKHKGTPIRCRCLEVLSQEDYYCTAVANYQMTVMSLEKYKQQRIVVEWLRHHRRHPSDKSKYTFRMPFYVAKDDARAYQDLREAFICHNAMLDIFARGYGFWKKCVQHHEMGLFPTHGNCGETPNNKKRFMEDHKKHLEKHFAELLREAEPIATRYVRELTGETTLRDAEDDLVYLPPTFTVRGCYAKFCHDEKGVIVTANNKGTVSVARADSCDGSEEEVVDIKVPSLTSYCNYWKCCHPNLKVRKPTEDICNYCYKIYNGHKFGSSVSLSAAETEEAANLSMEEMVLETEEDQVDFMQSVSTENGLNIPESLTQLADSKEKELLEAAMHVKQALAMRALVNEKMETAKEHRNENVPHCDRVYTLVADFCQNMELPHFGSNQPGETYYLTPARLEGFGVVDVSHSGKDGSDVDPLYFHCFLEGHGAKGGSNVASMIVKTLNETGIMRRDGDGAAMRGKELNVVMDNCAGQNKNNHVLLLAPYLVEMGYFRTVNMLFLVAGHTKNVCDRRFNNLKSKYHNAQVFTFDQAVEILGNSEHVHVWKIDPQNDWKNYGDFLRQPYVTLAEAKLAIAKNHIFCAEWLEEHGGEVKFYTRQSALDEHKEAVGRITNPKFSSGGTRKEVLKSMVPATIEYKGLPGYKQVLMSTKFKEYVPPKDRNDPLYAQPSREVLNAEADDQRARRLSKKQKRESTTLTSANV
ncbi:hypothetical protein IV203_014936 [Nitzschia inconspicua]|uniref:DUF7869 domain-containing protein n=1 Tax=Nitzschia inconspicua TaxID=303405 RepID=A0A9K3PT17_9STRA|nr:hypothetical protein IV203_014936 [Nitzschia inconspicua]